MAAIKLGDSKTLSSRVARVYIEVYYLCEATEGGKFLALEFQLSKVAQSVPTHGQ